MINQVPTTALLFYFFTFLLLQQALYVRVEIIDLDITLL